MMTRLVPGGRRRILELIALATSFGERAAEDWWEVYSALRPNEQKKASLDDVCAAANVQPSDLLGVIVSVGCRQGEDVSAIVESSLRPKVVAQLAKSALRIESTRAHPLSDTELLIASKDRERFLQHSEFLPVPRNAGVRVNVSATSSSQAAAAASAEPSVPSFAEDMRSLERPKELVQRQLLETPVPERVVDGEACE